MLRRTVLHVSLCMLLAQHITGEPQNIDGLQNEDIVLCPVLDGKLEEITWKLGNNKVAEYDLFKIITYYGDFKEQTKLNITSGCLKMNNITDRRDGLYKAELQIRGKLQEREFKLKVYRPVSKPTVTCSVTDSNVTLICEGDESLGDHYRWEGHENQVLRVANEGKYLTFSKEDHNIEYTCIFSNLKSEERSDRVKNCFVPGRRSHILVPILVFPAVLPLLAGLIVWCYKSYAQSQGRKTADYQAVHNEEGNSETTTTNNMQSTLPLHGPQQCDVHVDANVNSKATENAHTSKKEVVNGTEEIPAPDPGSNEQSKMGSAEKGTQDEEQQKKETEDAQTSSESRATENAHTGKKEVVNGTQEIPAPDPGSNEQRKMGSPEKGTQDEEQQRKESEDAETSSESEEKANTGKKELANGTEEIPASDPGINEQTKMGSPEKGTQDEEQQRKESEDAQTSSESRENANTGKKAVVDGTEENQEPVPGINVQSNKGSAEKGTQDDTSSESRDVTPSPDSPPQTTGMATTPLLAPPRLDLVNSPPTLETATTPPTLETAKTPPPLETANTPLPPGDDKDSSHPGDSKDFSHPGNGKDSSTPGDGKDFSHPGDDKDSSHPGDSKDFSHPGDGKDSSPPGDGKDSSPLEDGKDSSPPEDGKDSSPPRNVKDASPPGDIKGFSLPAEGKGSSPLGDGKGPSPPRDDKGPSPPGDGKDSSPPRDDKDSSPPEMAKTPPLQTSKTPPPLGGGKGPSPPGDDKGLSPPGDGKDSSPLQKAKALPPLEPTRQAEPDSDEDQ
ncbi:uncharacterized protein LOC117406987 isoform X2 [Acipenser ruthenus]|uniref:uncharacterized protein LOC117406987 isoform X2 n=1 Tax=Acipenser ruthenus TaxID=7906 RepID=UPI002741435F|nr:uncharacterized protein LOC117406987 isoform X2 [Acipenser ruthenus]